MCKVILKFFDFRNQGLPRGLPYCALFAHWNGSLSTKPCQLRGQRENVVRVTVPEGFTMMLRRRLDRAPGRVFFQARPARGGFGVGRPGWLGHETLPPG